MITHNRLYATICSFENLLWAARRAEQGKRMQDTIGRFRTDLEAELLQLRHELVAKTYTPGPYRETIITRPKRRMISAAPFRDRVVHHAVCNVVMPLFERKMIFVHAPLFHAPTLHPPPRRVQPKRTILLFTSRPRIRYHGCQVAG